MSKVSAMALPDKQLCTSDNWYFENDSIFTS